MKRLLIIFFAALLLVAPTSCNLDDGFDMEFLERREECARINGNEILTYDPLTCQISFNREKKTFRVCTDNMSDYFVLSMSQLPSEEGQTLTATLKWTDGGSIKTKSGLEFSVKGWDGGSGRAWLWCAKEKTALIVRIF